MAGFSSARSNGRLSGVASAWNRFGPYLVAAFLAALFSWAVFLGKGGLDESDNTTIWLVTLALSGVTVATSISVRGTSRLYGGITLGVLALYTVLVAVSIAWSLIPSATWLEFNRTVAYLAAFAGGIALARLWRKSWLSRSGALQ